MTPEALPLTTIGVVIIIATVFSIFIKKLGQNEVIGFILAGVILGPIGLNFLNPSDLLVAGFAELGLFVLLFYLGIELSHKEFLRSGHAIFALAFADMLLTIGIGVGIMLLLGFSLMFSIIVGIMLFSTSTAIVARFIINNGLINRAAAKTSLAILVLQDFLGILLLVFVTSLQKGEGSVGWLAFASVVFAVSAFYAVYHLSRLVEGWLRQNEFGHTEITLYALGVGLITATLAGVLGLATAIGAHMAGFALSETDSGQRIKKDVGFLRDFFLVFFFVGFGTTLFYDYSARAVIIPQIGQLLNLAALATGLAIAAILSHSIVAKALGPHFGLRGEDTSLMAILLSPLGEFVVIIATVVAVALPPSEGAIIRPVAFMLILVTLFLFQPLYNAKAGHQRLFAAFPSLPLRERHEQPKEKGGPALHLRDALTNAFVILCFAGVTFLLYNELPRFGVPIIYSRQITAALLFIFFASVPFIRGIRALRRLGKEMLARKRSQPTRPDF